MQLSTCSGRSTIACDIGCCAIVKVPAVNLAALLMLDAGITKSKKEGITDVTPQQRSEQPVQQSGKVRRREIAPHGPTRLLSNTTKPCTPAGFELASAARERHSNISLHCR
jgi:hypothetical protein